MPPIARSAPVAPVRRDPEANIIHALLAALGTTRLAIGFALDERLGAEATVAVVFAALGFVGLFRDGRRAR